MSKVDKNKPVKTVYRIQDAEGRGPFNPGQTKTWSIMRDDLENLRPWTEQFGIWMLDEAKGKHMGCGCTTLAQLRRWFIPREYRTLVKRGYNAVELQECEVLAESNIQCVFTRKEPLKMGAKRIELY